MLASISYWARLRLADHSFKIAPIFLFNTNEARGTIKTFSPQLLRYTMDISHLLAFSVKNKASDLILVSGLPPLLRLFGDIRKLNMISLQDDDIRIMLDEIITEKQRTLYRSTGRLIFIYDPPGLPRIRVTTFKHYRGIGVAFRMMPRNILTLEQIGAPRVFRDAMQSYRGLIIVNGRYGSGRSTTLAAMIEAINLQEYSHIVILEDAVEFVHQSKKSVITQRELGTRDESYASAVRTAIASDPDVIVIGVLHDAETMRAALLAAESGYLVLASMDTATSIGTIRRLTELFPANERDHIRSVLSDTLIAVFSQRLARLHDGSGRIAVHEILVNTPSVRALLAQGRNDDLYSLMESSNAAGMTTFDQSVFSLLRRRLISVNESKKLARYPEHFRDQNLLSKSFKYDRPLLGFIVPPGSAMPGRFR